MRRFVRFLAFGLLALALSPAALAQRVAWARAINGPAGAAAYPGDGRLVTRSLAADSAGNVFITGSTRAGSQSDFLTTKLAAGSGAVAWQRTVAGAAGRNDDAIAVAVDASGNAIVAGISQNSANNDIRVVKHAAADGAVLWDRIIDGGRDEGAFAVSVNASGNVVVGAEAMNANGDSDIRVLVLSGASGATVWERTFDGGRGDFVSDLALDAAGGIFVLGASTNASGGTDIRVIKYSAAGTLVWQQAFAAGEGYALVVDAANNVLLAGYSTGATTDFRVLKLSGANGSTLWQRSYDGGRNDAAQAIALDDQGNAYVTGHSQNAAGRTTFKTIKYAAADGATLWERTYDGGVNDYAYQIAIDGDGHAVVVGTSFSGTQANWKVIAYGVADGSVRYEYTHAGAAGLDDDAVTVAALGPAVVVGGISMDAASTASVRVARLEDPAASLTSPAPGARLAGSSQDFSWTDAGASLYQVFVGTSVGAYDIGYYPQAGTRQTSTTVTGLPTDGRTLYVRLYSSVGGVYYSRDYVFTAAAGSSPASSGPASIATPADGATLAGATQAFSWNAAAGATLYQLWIGSTPGAYDVGYYPPAGTTGTSLTVSGLPTDGRTLYVRLHSAIGGAWQFRDFTFKAAGSGAVAGPAAITSPAAGSVLGGASQLFEWNAAIGATFYQLWLGSTPGGYDLGYSPASSATSATMNGLPTDGRTVHARLYSSIGGAYQFRDFTFTASGTSPPPGPAALTSPVEGSVLGPTQQFQWSAAAGATFYQLWVGSTPGGYDLGYSPASAATSATINGLPRDGRPIYVRLYSAIGGAYQFRDYQFQAAR